MNLRDDRSSMGTDREEREANAFAAELLMPGSMVKGEVQAILERGGTADGRFVADLAQVFDVGEQAIEYRLVNLGLRRQI